MSNATTKIEYPAQQREASQASQSNKQLATWLMSSRLLVLIAIATLAVFTTWLTSWKLGFLIVSVVLFATLTAVEVIIWVRRPEKDWYDARSLTEAIKTLAWRYAVKDDTFVGAEDIVDQQFTARLKQTMDYFKSLTLLPGTGPQSPITPWMKETRTADFFHRKSTYLEHRVKDQISWLSAKVKENDIAYKRWSALLVAMYLAGVICALFEIADLIKIDVLGVVGAIAASALAWVQSKQHANLAHEYSITRNNLQLLLPRFESVTEDNWVSLVDDVEDELAREHSAWQAQRRKPSPE